MKFCAGPSLPEVCYFFCSSTFGAFVSVLGPTIALYEDLELKVLPEGLLPPKPKETPLANLLGWNDWFDCDISASLCIDSPPSPSSIITSLPSLFWNFTCFIDLPEAGVSVFDNESLRSGWVGVVFWLLLALNNGDAFSLSDPCLRFLVAIWILSRPERFILTGGTILCSITSPNVFIISSAFRSLLNSPNLLNAIFVPVYWLRSILKVEVSFFCFEVDCLD